MSDFTDAERQRYLESDGEECPFCFKFSTHQCASQQALDRRTFVRRRTCSACGASWWDEYILLGAKKRIKFQ
jgi:hypothetical protein